MFEVAGIENNMIEDHVFETDIRETAMDVDHVLNRLIEVDVRIADVCERRNFEFKILAF